MSLEQEQRGSIDRREFLRGAAGVATGLLTIPAAAQTQATPEAIDRGSAARPLNEKEKHDRIATNCWPMRYLFTVNSALATDPAEVVRMKKKYGEITVLDFPAFTKEHFPGVYQMDLIPLFFGDNSDDSMFMDTKETFSKGVPKSFRFFNPMSPSGKKWLDKLANKQVATGTRCHHISNDAPRDLCDLDPELRKAGIQLAKQWLDVAAMLGAKSMRVNTGGPLVAPGALTGDVASGVGGLPKNDALQAYLDNAVESFKELADYGGKVGVKVTIENHWGIAANPTNIRIILEEVNSPYCEASPDFGNWEYEGLLYHGLNQLAPYAHTHVHAKYWDRWKNPDVQRGVRIMLNANYTGVFGLEYEAGPWDGVEGAQYLYREVMAAL